MDLVQLVIKDPFRISVVFWSQFLQAAFLYKFFYCIYIFRAIDLLPISNVCLSFNFHEMFSGDMPFFIAAIGNVLSHLLSFSFFFSSFPYSIISVF
jgi:hypothetical protein